MTPQQHRPGPFVALVAGVSLSLWLVVSAGVQTATTHSIRIPQPPTSAALKALSAAPMPTAGTDLSIEVR